ncbi:DUF6114 domain-containing protein [Micromonospora sp. NBS 11-29]|uniref:DUF6114 domain-containing protein n=1 Tax=Micromonospora sp. NBS 11-29 TaxID=1960879 RepID=UPI000B770738|nr:DUF6114 domain-containing protein [Micromonospora sp. NBS 11-29]
MTTAETQQARPGRLGQAWRGFRRWRRARPFWGGLLTALAGLEIFATTQMSLNGLTFQMGPTGFLSWLIPTILVACGMLLWFSPAQRLFYAVVASITALYSLIGVNLGGFFIGLLLGMVGGALGFAWVPRTRPDARATTADPVVEPVPEPVGEPEPALVDELLPRQREEDITGVLTDTLPEPRNPLRESAPTEPDAPRGPGHPPRAYTILLVLAVSAAGLVAVRDQRPAVAAPAACPTASAPAPRPSTSKTASASPSASPSTTAPAEPTEPTQDADGNLLTDLVDGITDLFTGGDDEEKKAEPSPSPSSEAPAPARSGTATPAPSGSAKPSPTAKPDADCGDDGPAPTKPKPVEEGKPLPRLAADPDQPLVADPPSRLTGSKVTMTGLRFEGVVDLPTHKGTLKCLKFTMKRAVTDDFTLLASGPAGKKQRYVTNQLTVEGDVAFYATRFVGHLLGIKITLTPDLPFPDGIPITSPLPITFDDPVMELAYENSKSLTAKPVLRVDLA